MKIGELAARTATAVETIRYYEREGLLPRAPRSDGNYRQYSAADADRLAFVRRCRALDMTLDEVRVLLRFVDAPAEDCAGIDALVDQHIAHVAERLRELRQLDRELKALRAHCQGGQPAAGCGVLAALVDTAAAATPRRGRAPVAPPARPAAHAHPAGVHAARRGTGRR